MRYTRHRFETPIDFEQRKQNTRVKTSGLMIFIGAILICAVLSLMIWIIVKAAGEMR